MKENYMLPCVEEVLVLTEQGFAASTPDNITGTTEDVENGNTY